MASIAQRIKEALKIRDMKQADLVEKTKIGKSSISTYLSGAYEPKQKNIYLIAKALNVSEAWLMGYDVPMERKSAPDSEQAFLTYLSSLGYNLYRDDPEHKPFMSSENISSCKLGYDTLDNLKLQIDSFTKATIDSELLTLKEKELHQERIEKEKILQHLRAKSKTNVIPVPQKDQEHLKVRAAHNDNASDPEQQRLMAEDIKDIEENW